MSIPGNLVAKDLFERLAFWSEEDIEKLEQAASAIEAWRNGEYQTRDEELHAIDGKSDRR